MHMRPLIPGLALIVGSLVTACSHVDEITPRAYVGLVVGHAARLKIEIAKSLVANPSAPVPQAGYLRLEPPAGTSALDFDFGWITQRGAIVLQSKKYGVILVQEPVLAKDGIAWTCVVHPAEAKPSMCGSSDQNLMLQGK